MQRERYELNISRKSFSADFVSIGTKGSIKKIISFEETAIPNLYNLAFGDRFGDHNDFDDSTVTNNGDTKLVLATVAYSVEVFTRLNTNAWVYAKGFSAARNRLYQMGINKHFNEVSEKFEILAELEGKWENYKSGKNYDAFAVKRKI